MGRFFYFFTLCAILSSIAGQYIPQYLKTKYGNRLMSPSPASYSGVKTHVKTKTSYSSGPPGSKYKGGCNSMPPTPANSAIRCSQYSGCKVDCIPNYLFPNGDSQVFLTCKNGEWIAEALGWTTIPACQPICLPPCQNNGICVAPNQCQCPEKFSGPVCQYENQVCLTPPPMPTNARRQCIANNMCTISCMAGYQFPDGSSITNVMCKNGYWVPSQPKWPSVPDCEATCTPACQNGGICISFNYCQCPQEFRGPQCQYSVADCSPKKIDFNGGYTCRGDQRGMSCVLKCPAGTEFETLPSPEYVCLYHEGVFKPSPVPQCVFPSAFVTPRPNWSDFDSIKINGKPIKMIPQTKQTYVVTPSGDVFNSFPAAFNSFSTAFNSFPTANPREMEIMETKLPEPGVCFTWEGSHYKTFDGKVFSFTSKCAHVLVRDGADYTFNVVVQNHPQCDITPSDCSKIIKVFLGESVYILKRSEDGMPVFSTPKKRLPIPGQLPGLRIEMSAHFIILSLDTVGSVIKWDGRQLIQVEVQESLWNRTEGLCGKLDSNDANDMVDKNGHKPQLVSNLAISWKSEDLEHECDDIPSEEHTCRDNEVLEESRSRQATSFCKSLLTDKRFAPCHNIIDTSLLLDACRWDYCGCKHQDPTKCACETINVYVRACTFKGVKELATWRDASTCPMQCTGGKVYKSCGPAAGQPVCGSSTEENEDNREGCVEGCYCPERTVLHENRCISRAQCPCKLRNKSFPPGAQIPKECNTCTCNEGKWVCTQVSCGARCAAIGDPHYVTFDGKRFDFMGQCSYYLVKTDSFSIEAENVACAGSISQAMNLPASVSSGLPSCTKTVTVRLNGQTIKLKQNHDVVVNGRDIARIPYQIANTTIRSISSIFLQVDLPNGVQIWWDGVTRVYVDIPARFEESTGGLCGTFNSNQKDDFLTPEGDVEQAVIPFANKWKTSEKCNDVPDAVKSHPCSANVQNQPIAEQHCRTIKSDLFSACHWIVDPEPFHRDCLYDMCSCENNRISKCLCPIVAAYAEECARKGVKIEWRGGVRECGVRCPSGQKYQVCGNSCTRTCLDIAMRPDCKPQCVEGCNCPEGEALNEDGECVAVGECKCQYDGLAFHAGYKEVRPASKGLELCTCINALWSCRLATPDEEKKYPRADDLKSLCSATENLEFTTCEPVEPVTCKNMHSPDYFSASVCHPGCKCKDEYVLDTATKKCVKPSECPCHHGGRSYKENATVQNDCNTCRCQNGKWTCTERPCWAECSAWGDSHFTTFDGKHFDFQGQCDYILAKGSSGSGSFDISIQNVPCGTLGTSCSKSVTIRVKVGEDQDSIILTRDKSVPTHKNLKHVTLRKVGLLVITEAPDLGLVIQWDKGTRVYVKADPRWKGRTMGLCGNYNDNEADDFQTPSAGISEVSVKIFGDSWKLQPYCPESIEITNTCEDRPDRKIWAMKKCGILKSSLFAPCHSEVPVDIYLERCIFDTCACDQGGDCECLCTALAAYAQECNNRGVPIKWRSQELCPLQCDERCTNYNPCMSTCPVETCDDLAKGQVSKNCKEETCIEGCAPKPCPADHIYSNSSLLECVPINTCKPKCLEVDGVTYYEGDLMEEDGCHTCYCSRGEKICKGQPCSTTQVFTTITPVSKPETQQIICEPGWTDWINQDKVPPSKTHSGKKKSDYEPLPTSLVMNNIGGGKCSIDQMVDIECRTVVNHLSPKDTGLNVECSLEKGLACESNVKGESCVDFEMRVLCACEETTTPILLTTASPECDLLIPHSEHKENCSLYYFCENTTAGPRNVIKSCGPSKYYHPVERKCAWPYEVEEIKPECKETPEEGTVPPEPEFKEGCPEGTVKQECVIQCDRLCGFYSGSLRKQGLCTSANKCEDACVNPQKNVTKCLEGMFYNDQDTCVDQSDCLCVSNDGKPVKPGVDYRESDCKICQCIDNYYSCDDTACFTTTKRPTKPPKGSGPGDEDLPPVPPSVTPPENCPKDRLKDLIQDQPTYPDSIFNASSVLSEEFNPEKARFSAGGSWTPQYSDDKQYLEVNLGHQEPLYGVKVKGGMKFNEYVTSYKVTYSPDGTETFYSVLNKEKLPQIFTGSIDSTTPVLQLFSTPFEAQIIRIHPATWHNKISLKVELVGCGEPQTTTTPLFEFITTPTPVMCDEPMGLDDGTMSTEQISVSSELDRDHGKNELKIGGQAWQPLTNTPTEFITFDFLELRNLTGLKTKGGPDGWVTAFKIQYSQDNKDWNPILDKTGTRDQIFLGNFDENTTQINHFDLPIQARYLKIVPTKWQENIQMRVEVHGCFEPYPTLPEQISTPSPVCNVCNLVKTKPLELGACRCSPVQWWDGEKCVNKTACPCVVGHIRYSVGTVYTKDDCSECLCKLGGVSYCSKKQCEPCEKGLRSTVTTNCQCTCQPCPDGTTLCPTSNVCINTTLWCNGVRDCPDDETGCPTTPKPIELVVTTEATTLPPCPEFHCPEGFFKVLAKKSRTYKYLSPMFLKQGRKTSVKSSYMDYYGGVKTAFVKKPSLTKPPVKNTTTTESICPEYTCKYGKPPPPYVNGRECPLIYCPKEYIPVVEENKGVKKCPEYDCHPPPPQDATCNVTGKSFTTFDGSEFKYDICNHILVRDLANDEWNIILRQNCSTGVCSRDLVIYHQDHTFVLHSDLTLEYDGFKYTVDQTKKIGSQSQAFSITRLGNTLVFVSNRYGFWLRWTNQGDIKINAVRKLKNTLDGLCGFFNENPSDDKRKPDGNSARTTVEFGDSWQTGASEVCKPKTCPLDVQKKAWKLCQIKDQILEPCTKVINMDAYVSRCMESTCECLQKAGTNQSAEEECRCNALTNYVVDCLTAEPSTDLSDWRVTLDCPVSCEAPLVYHDCYQRNCERTCDSINDPQVCPKIANVCFPGCYCPSGFVKKGDTCIKPSDCKDCECNVLPHLKYVTYDDNNFTVNTNCVYVMSRDVLEDNKHKFQVLITNAPCKNNEAKRCVGKVTILYQGRKIHILNDLLRNRLKLVVDGERIDDITEISEWARVKETATKHYKILLTDVQVEVSVYYPSLGVSVKAPSQKYAGKLEGLCGNCDREPDNDFTTPSGQLLEDTDEFALSWLYENLPGGQDKEMCRNKVEECPSLPKESDPCNLILDYKTFGQCLRLLDPSLFLEWCKKDTCDNHPEFACTSIEAYARDCANAGFCIDWRTNICPKTCPAGTLYNPCGPSCPKTCQTLKEGDKPCPNKPTDGCFCPEGKVLLNDTCVDPKDCEVCDNEGHHPGDKWKKDKCTTCTCEGTSLKCETEKCSSNQICQEGYIPIKSPAGEDECCDKYACAPEPAATCETPQPIVCGHGQITKLSTKENGCQHFVCECKPKEQCDVLPTQTALEAGFEAKIDESGCCPEMRIVCNKELCPQPPSCPQYHSLKNETGKCCPSYTCEPPKNKCIYELEYISAENGGERPRNEMEKQKVLKSANETWDDGPCRRCKCSLGGAGGYSATCTKTDCPAFIASVDYEIEEIFVYDRCCPEVKRVACKQGDRVYKIGETWTKTGDPCTLFKCVDNDGKIEKETEVKSCDSNCELGLAYIPAQEPGQCCGSCKPFACVFLNEIHKEGEQWQSEDHCINYFCLNTNGTLQVQSQTVNCPEPPPDYEDNFVYKTVSVEGECCKEYVTTACLVNGTEYQVGETWPSPDGDKCKKITCARNDKNEIIKQEKIETCNTNCSKGWEYVESKTSCCGECVQVACLFNEKVYKEGQQWQSEDHCTNYFCINTNGTLQVQSQPVRCPEPPPDYKDNFVFEVLSMEGECCKEYVSTACLADGKEYKVGETWPAPDGDKCKKIACVKNDKGEIMKQEKIETCKTNCSTGWDYVPSNSSCCGECIQTACVVEEQLKYPDETWSSPDNCTTYSCEQLGDQFMISSNQESCPSLKDCPEENIYVKGCCKHCNLTAEAQILCAVKEVQLNSTVGLIKKQVPELGYCKNKKPIHAFTECKGSCLSASTFNKQRGTYENDCSCCQAVKHSTLDVELECEYGQTFTVQISVPSQCGCLEGCGGKKSFTKTKSKTFVKT